MPDDNTSATIITPTLASGTVNTQPPATKSIPIIDQSEPAAPLAATVPPPEPALKQPVAAQAPPAEAPLAADPSQQPVAVLPVTPKQSIDPPEGSNVPQFGALQAKVDAHPLFSGAKAPPPKRRRHWGRILWPLASLLIVIVLAYLAIDAGLVRGASHLPFHVFKQKIVATAPVIQTTVASTNTQAKTSTADPYAGWASYCDKFEKACFKYPKTWTLNGSANPSTTYDSISLVSPSGNTEVNYTSPAQDSGSSPCPYSKCYLDTISVSELTISNTKLKAVESWYHDTSGAKGTSWPETYIQTSDFINQNKIAAGATSTIASQIYDEFTSLTNSSGRVVFNAEPFPTTGGTATFDTHDEAVAWLNSADAKQALLIIRSFYYQ